MVDGGNKFTGVFILFIIGLSIVLAATRIARVARKYIDRFSPFGRERGDR